MPRRRHRRPLFARHHRSASDAPSAATAVTVAAAIRHAAEFQVELLERRTMLTQIGIELDGLGNPIIDPVTGTVVPLLDGTFEFVQGNPRNQVLVAWHDIRAELIGVSVDKTATDPQFDIPIVSNLYAATTPGNVPTTTPNLYTIFITHASADSWLSIAEIPASNPNGDPRPMNPFGGSVGPLAVLNAGSGKAPTFTPNVGAVLLGNKFVQAKVDQDQAVLSVPLTGGFGLYPGDPSGLLLPGVIMTATDYLGDGVNPPSNLPNDIGYFMFGGTITGRVFIPSAGTSPAPNVSTGGNVGLFYAGNLLTGDAQGLLQGQYVDLSTIDPTTGQPLVQGIGTINGVISVTSVSASDVPPNFFIGGDVRDLIVGGTLGGAANGATTRELDLPKYLTGFRGVIGGTAGQITVVGGQNYGTWDVQHNPSVIGLPENLFAEPELEYKVPSGDAPGNAFQGGIETGIDPITGAAVLLPPRLDLAGIVNDTPATAQQLGSIKEADPRTGGPLTDSFGNFVYEATVTGQLQDFQPPDPSDVFDYYSVPLMAGQTVTVTATTSAGVVLIAGRTAGTALLQLQIVDPDGRLIATDENSHHPLATLDKPISFTADRPGLYKFGITRLPGIIFEGQIPYTLKIEGVGDMGLGGLTTRGAGGDIFDAEFDKSISVDHGDLGVLQSSNVLLSNTLGPTPVTVIDPTTGALVTAPLPTPTSYFVAAGDLRTIQAPSIAFQVTAPAADTQTGVAVASAFGDIPYLDVPNGNVGLISETGGSSAAGGSILALQTRFDLTTLTPPGTTGSSPTPVSAIGGSFQIISALDQCYLVIAANGGIGDLRAGQMSTNPASFIDVNADDKGNDGIIDLVDVAGAFGDLGPGGPGFVTHTGGDIRFMVIGGLIFTDRFFGNSEIVPTALAVGADLKVTDDSGNLITATPIGAVIQEQLLQGTTTVSETTGPSITYETYPVRDKGGQVILSLLVTNNSSVATTAGLTITANGSNSARAEIGSITFPGTGLGLQTSATTDKFGNTTLSEQSRSTVVATFPTFQEADLTLNGPVPIDVLDVIDTGGGVTGAPPAAGATATGTVSAGSIFNNSGGDTINITATADLNTISSKTDIGIATPRATPAAILPTTSMFPGAVYPLNGVLVGINATANILNITANGSVGNVLCGGIIQNLIANANGAVAPGSFDGIKGNIEAANMYNVSLGQGLLPSGSGEVSFAGLYATGTVGTVTSNGTTYIRGNIISLNAVPTVLGIDAINIVGSIVNADIGTYTAFNMATADINGVVIPIVTPPVPIIPQTANLDFQLGSIKVQGFGGIIGSFIHAYTIGPTAVAPQGFGVINTDFSSTSDGHIAGVSAGGYGIRGVTITGGLDVDALVAYGNGSLLSTQTFPQELRVSETGQLDPFFVNQPNEETDLDIALGVTKAAPNVANVTDTGVIQDCVVQGRGILGTVQAQKVRTTLPLLTPVVGLTPQANIPQVGQAFPMSLAFAGGIQSILIRGPIDGLQVTAGHLGGFVHNGSISRLGISVAGPIAGFRVNGNLGQTITDPATGNPIPDSYVQATGGTGVINSFLVTGDMSANVVANANIIGMTIGKNVFGSITTGGQSQNLALSFLHIGGGLSNGALTINGSAGTIIANESFGSAGGALNISGNLGMLAVGVDHRDLNAHIGLDLNVGGSLTNLTVFGRIDGSITTAGDLGHMAVISPVLGNNAINGSVNVGGNLGSAMIVNGQVNGNISANGSIGSFTLQRGSVLAGKTIESQLNAISIFRIVGGLAFGMFGNLLQPTGAGGSIDISGDVGNGTDAATITALAGNTYHVHGSIKTGASIAVTGQLNLLQVDHNIETGATVSAHPLKRLVVIGENLGSVTTT
jgi:hypothetical protein